MGAIFACGTVLIIAVGGLIYFEFFDKRRLKES